MSKVFPIFVFNVQIFFADIGLNSLFKLKYIFFNKKKLSYIKKNAIIINTSRR